MDDSVTFDIEDEEGKKRREVCDYTIKKSHVCIFRAFANFGSIIIKEVLILKYEKKKNPKRESGDHLKYLPFQLTIK